MLGTLALKAIGLLAAFTAAAIASPAVEKRGVYDPPPPGFPQDLKTLSYTQPYDIITGEELDACAVFESYCRYEQSHVQSPEPYSFSMIVSCRNDKENFLVTGSCVMADCHGKALGYTSTFVFSDIYFQPHIFSKTEPCGKSFCPVDPSKVPKSDNKPVVLGDNKILFPATCPHAPPFGARIH